MEIISLFTRLLALIFDLLFYRRGNPAPQKLAQPDDQASQEIKQVDDSKPNQTEKKPTSVNYHFSRVCNYGCQFCFHTETNNNKLKLEEAKRGLQLLKEAGMKKINFAGTAPHSSFFMLTLHAR